MSFGDTKEVSPVSSTGFVRTPPGTIKGNNIQVEDYFSGISSGCFMQFMYTDRVYLEIVIPSSGNDLGGTMLTMVGQNFFPQCLLFANGSSIPIKKISSTLILCYLPSHSVGLLSLSIHCGDHSASKTYLVTTSPEVYHIEPSQIVLVGNRPQAAASVMIIGK